MRKTYTVRGSGSASALPPLRSKRDSVSRGGLPAAENNFSLLNIRKGSAFATHSNADTSNRRAAMSSVPANSGERDLLPTKPKHTFMQRHANDMILKNLKLDSGALSGKTNPLSSIRQEKTAALNNYFSAKAQMK